MTDRDSPSVSRRTVVKSTGAAGLAGLGGIAGCLGGGGGEGTTGGNGSGGGEATDSGGSGGSGQALEVLHGWTGGDGQKAVDALTQLFNEQHSDMPTDFRPIGGGGNTNLNTVISKRLGNSNPPSSFAGWPGASLTQYDGVLGNADPVWEEFKDKHVQEAVDLCQYNGTFSAVPIGSHRLNELFYNVKVVEEAGVNPDEISDFQGLVSALKKVSENTEATPMAHAMKLPWTTLQLFAVNLLSTQGYDAYMAFTKGNGEKSKVVGALESTKQILNNYINDDASSIGLTGSNQMIMNGDAAFIHQGNWAAGAYKGNDLKYGEDWGAVTYPGTEGMYTLHIDSFIMPANNPSPEKTKAWLSFAGTPEAQVTFGSRKGCIPTRTDAKTDEFGEYLTNTIEEFQNAEQKPPTLAHGLAVSPTKLNNCKSAISNNFSGPYNVDKAADALMQAVSGGES